MFWRVVGAGTKSPETTQTHTEYKLMKNNVEQDLRNKLEKHNTISESISF